MKQIVTITILLLQVLLVSCSDEPAAAAAQDDPAFSVELRNLNDGIVFQHTDNRTIIDIVSPAGIGGAKFTLRSGQMPRRIVVWLHLKGLEEFRLISEKVTLSASVPSTGGLSAQGQQKIVGDSEQPIGPFDPLRIRMEIVSTSPDIPLQDGYFEIVIPDEFLQQSGNSFEIQWIDFYR